MSPQQTPPLSLCDRIHALPQELIDMVYDEVLVMLKDTIPTHTNIKVDSRFRVPSILQLTHNLRNTHRMRYYTLNDFDFDPLEIPMFEKWISPVCRDADGETSDTIKELVAQGLACIKHSGLLCHFDDWYGDGGTLSWKTNRWMRSGWHSVRVWWQERNEPGSVEWNIVDGAEARYRYWNPECTLSWRVVVEEGRGMGTR